MEVQVISNTAQKFNGESYYLCGSYYQRKGKRLHRSVWEFHNGEIPNGYHVHHKDGNKDNNQISNLMLLDGSKHLSVHMSKPERVEQSRRTVLKAIAKAPEWHGSKEGAEWHSQHAKEYWATAPLQTYTCTFCGKEFQTKKVSYKGNHFCRPNCKAAHRRQRIRNEG